MNCTIKQHIISSLFMNNMWLG